MENVKPSEFTQREFAIWLSAWIDSDGCILFNKTRRKNKRRSSREFQYSPIVQIANCCLKPLEYMKAKYGGGIYQMPTRATHIDCYRWTVYCKKAAIVLQDTAPFLVRKKKQAQIILKLRERIPRTYRGRHRTDEEMILSEKCYQEIRALNVTRRYKNITS